MGNSTAPQRALANYNDLRHNFAGSKPRLIRFFTEDEETSSEPHSLQHCQSLKSYPPPKPGPQGSRYFRSWDPKLTEFAEFHKYGLPRLGSVQVNNHWEDLKKYIVVTLVDISELSSHLFSSR